MAPEESSSSWLDRRHISGAIGPITFRIGESSGNGANCTSQKLD